jgi:hypothetical protein
MGNLNILTYSRKRVDDVWPDDSRIMIYIGSQGIVQGTYETYAAAADKHFAEPCGYFNVTAGLGDGEARNPGHYDE